MDAASRRNRHHEDRGFRSLRPHGASSPRLKPGLPAILAALALVLGPWAAPGEARASLFEGFPDVLLCNSPEIGTVAFYASYRNPEGLVIYRAQVERTVNLTVSPTGAISSDFVFCKGETVEGLRAAGRAFDLTGS